MIALSYAKEHTEDEFKAMCTRYQHIKQGYLAFGKGTTTRIRCINGEKKEKWYLTFKHKVSCRIIEIENKIDDRDGQDLWNDCVGKLTKDRYTFELESGTWELDFFKKVGHLYFILVEVELKEGARRPKSLPFFLKKKHVLYEVPLIDDRFSNKRLGDAEYASKLYLEFTS